MKSFGPFLQNFSVLMQHRRLTASVAADASAATATPTSTLGLSRTNIEHFHVRKADFPCI